MTLRWMRPPELSRGQQADRFDPLAEGARYGLAHDLSLAIWKRVCADTTDHRGTLDSAQAEQRFHEIAVRVATKGGRLRPDVGRETRVGSELGPRRVRDELASRIPGREALAEREAEREPAEAAPASDAVGAPTTWQVSALDMRAWTPQAKLNHQLHRTFGAAAKNVPITESARAAGAEGVAVGEQVYIAPGYYDLTTVAGRERLGHEVAHVLQQQRGRDLAPRLSPRDRAGLEAEADRAGHAFARGAPFAVQGRAPTQVALFKNAAPPAGTTTTTTTIDLKAGGRIERKPPPPEDSPADASAPAEKPPKPREQLLITYGSVQATGPFTLERDDSGTATKLVGRGTLALAASRYVKAIDLEIALGSDGYLTAKLQGSATSMIKIGGLEIRGGTLSAGIEHGQLTYGLDGANLALPKNVGEGALGIQGQGDQEPAFDASLSINVPKLQPATMSFHADASGYRAEGSTGVDFKQASGSVTFSIEKAGEDRALWSAAGTVGYQSERLGGQISVQYNADGELSGEGTLDFKIADFLTGQATVAIDKEGHVTVNGEIRPPAQKELFPEKKVENTFFHKSVEFPIWGISIPMVGSVGLIAFIEGSLGYRVGVGAGVMRDIVLSGTYSTDPNVQPTFNITGEIFVPAFAELLISVGGGVKLDAFIAEIGGGVKVDGRAGFYGGLSVKPTLAYDNGQYRLTGQAVLAGDVGLSAQVDAFVRLHVGKWMFSWQKEWDWKLAEWNKWLGLNLGMEADLDYTLGQPLSPDVFKLKKPDTIDVQDIAKSAMPQGGMPPQGPKGAQNQKTDFKQKGGAAPATTSSPAQPKVAGTPAGGAGHKNQEPKGKNTKPATPPKTAPAKKAKGKDASQTGPDPKSNSKPSEQKTDATPDIVAFSMHGESHQLIVQLGPGGHVDMASKRERLSVKIGNAVGKLIAKHAPPQQIADLKELGGVAKKGDKMASTAKLPDKPGTQKVAQQIAAYGNKWEVKDLDEVAIKVPRRLVVTQPLKIDKPGPALAKAMQDAKAGQIYSQGGDAKEATRKLLEKHADARFDFASATLTLPAIDAGAISSAASAGAAGTSLGKQLGILKITLKKTDERIDTKVELGGTLGATAVLGVIIVPVEVPRTLTAAGKPMLDKPAQPLGQAIAKLASGATIWTGGVGDPKEVTANLLRAHADAKFDQATKNLRLSPVSIGALAGAASPAQLGQLIGQQTGVSKVTLQKTPTGFALHGHINPETTLLEGHVSFVPIEKTANMTGGSEQVKIVDHGGKPALVGGDGAPMGGSVRAALRGPFSATRNKTGAQILVQANKVIAELERTLSATNLSQGVAPDTQQKLEDGAVSVVAEVQHIGAGLAIATLKRASQKLPMPQQAVSDFNVTLPGSVRNGTHRANFEAEVNRQLKLQQDRINDQTIDSWIANVDSYKAYDLTWISKLSSFALGAIRDELLKRVDDTYAALKLKHQNIVNAKTNVEKVRKNMKTIGPSYTARQAIADLTSDAYLAATFTKRYSNEDRFREDHLAGINEVLARMGPQWTGLESSAGFVKNAILHNPDQIAGGFGMLPDITAVPRPATGADPTAWNKYIETLKAYVGASKVNSRLGPGWNGKIDAEYAKVRAAYPHEGGHPLWMMNLLLAWKYI